MNKNILIGRLDLRLLFIAVLAVVLMAGCSNSGDNGGEMEMTADSGQCWSQKGGVGNLLKNSSTKEECKQLGGKSWCPVGGGCEDL